MNILVHGSGLAGLMLGWLIRRQNAGHNVVIVEAGSENCAQPLLLDEARHAMLARHAAELAAGPWDASFDTIRIWRDGRETSVRMSNVLVHSRPRLEERLRSLALSSGCIIRPSPTDDDTVRAELVVDTRGEAVWPERVEWTGATWMLRGVVDTPCDRPIISTREHDGVFLQLTMIPTLNHESCVTIEAGAVTSPTEIARLFVMELNGATLRLDGEWQPAQARRITRSVDGRSVRIGRAAACTHDATFQKGWAELRDALLLSECLAQAPDADTALAAFDSRQARILERWQHASQVAGRWAENLPFSRSQSDVRFAFSLLTRHYRLDYETLLASDPAFMHQLESEFAARTPSTPPMFQPYTLRGLDLQNRIVFSPMAMRQGTPEGMPTDFHLTHLGSRAMGGAGLVFTEMSAVSPEGRISASCTAIYDDQHVPAWKRITDFVHSQSGCKIGLQLGHAGRKGSTRRAPDGKNVPLVEGGWELLAASPIPWSQQASVPRQVDRTEMNRLVEAYRRATVRAVEANFDMLEVHMAHGYLLSSFISPLTNQRDDEFGGSVENRMTFPLRVFRAVRDAWPGDRPISVRISAHDWAPQGLSLEEAVEVARLLSTAGCDMITVSTGSVLSGAGAGPEHTRCYQLPFSERIRAELGVPTMAVGTITSAGDANSILASGRADLCAIGRGLLYDPYFVYHAAREQGVELKWPFSYRTATFFKPHARTRLQLQTR
jgi:anthraniloyl-CoA monooxygenase